MKKYLLIALTILSLGATGFVIAKPVTTTAPVTANTTQGKYINTDYVVVVRGHRHHHRNWRNYNRRPVVIHRHYYYQERPYYYTPGYYYYGY